MSEKKRDKISKSRETSYICDTQKDMLQHIIRILPGCIYWKDKEGVYLGCNEVMLEIAGMDSIVGKTDFDLPWSSYAEEIRSNDLKAMNQKEPLEVEERGVIANGKHVVGLSRKVPLRNESGKVIGVIGTSLNITERKRFESSLLSSHEKAQSALESIVANMPGHVYWKDKNGVYLGCNNRQAQSLGFRYGNEVVGKTDFDLPWEEHQAEVFRENDRHIMESGKTEMIEESAVVDGKPSVVLSYKSPMRNRKGEITGVLGISIDISERKKMEAELHIEKNRAEAANIAKTEFLENMRHDIRTPLSGIVGFAELIQLKAQDPQIKDYSQRLVGSSHALLELLDEVLEAIHVSSGDLPKLKKKFKLERTAQKVMDLSQARALSKNLKLILNYDQTIPTYLVGDEVRVHRIILELLSNALNFTHAGAVHLSISLAKQEHRNVVIQIQVEDTGIGIPKEKQQEIFLQFKRLSPSYQGIYKGTGLGLSVIKQFIDELDGEIYVQSTLNEGAVFTCLIPLKKSLLDDDTGVELEEGAFPKTDRVNSADPSAESVLHAMNYRVLLVEDNPIAQAVEQAYLNQNNCAVDLVSEGKAAMSLWGKEYYDFVLMDVGLPDMNGYDLTRWMRAHTSINNENTPIIGLTAHVGEENKTRCLEAGMNLVLTKPLTEKTCHCIIESLKPKKTPRPEDGLPNHQAHLFHLDTFLVLDENEGIKHTGSKANLLVTLHLMLEQSLNEDLELLKQARTEGNWEEIQKVAHKIKGGLIYIGAVRLKMACEYLEHYEKAGQGDVLEKLYQQVLKVSDTTISVISEWIERNEPSS